MIPEIEQCKHCRIRRVRYDADHCSEACARVTRESELLHDARNLAHAALLRDEHDPLVGLSWLAFHWRPYAVGEEITIRDMAIEIAEQECTAAEHAVWRTLRSNPAVASMAQALEFKHTYTRQLAETMRMAA